MDRSGVVVVGSISTDVTAFASRLPAPGETVLGDAVTLVLGGKGANQAVAAAHLGVDTWMVGCVGQDPFAQIALGGLADHGVHTELVHSVPGATGVAHIRVDASGQNDIVITRLANDQVDEASVDHALASLDGRVRVLLLQLEVRPEVTAYAAKVGHSAGLTVVLDPAPAHDVPAEIWPYVDVVTPNESEAAAITGRPVHDADSAAEAATWFLERGTRQALVTMGAQGAVLVTPRQRRSYPTFRVVAVDTTAAGDAFTGTLGAALATGQEIDQAVRAGMAAGALAATRAGASSSLPTAAEIDDLLADPDRR